MMIRNLLIILSLFLVFDAQCQIDQLVKYSVKEYSISKGQVKLILKVSIKEGYTAVFNSPQAYSNIIVSLDSATFEGQIETIGNGTWEENFLNEKELVYRDSLELVVIANKKVRGNIPLKITIKGVINNEETKICVCFCEELIVTGKDFKSLSLTRIKK